VPDYSEFPTTPTAWQERQLQDWQTITPLSTEDPERPPRKRVDLVALIPGLFFILLALVFLAGLDVPLALFDNGGLLWLVLIGAGIALLVSELRKSKKRKT
jgi:hypothetical protein